MCDMCDMCDVRGARVIMHSIAVGLDRSTRGSHTANAKLNNCPMALKRTL